jgi:peptide-methionine (R)-S-oxide reductase
MKHNLNRRFFLYRSVAAVGAFALATSPLAARARFEVSKSPEEWRRTLTNDRYAVLREGKTETAGSSPLNREKRSGTYQCAGCLLPVFSSAAKYDSGTGWPSFYGSRRHAVATRVDDSLAVKRTEVHCRRCGGHLGHVFDDGPKPTGKRYCINGLAMLFSPG